MARTRARICSKEPGKLCAECRWELPGDAARSGNGGERPSKFDGILFADKPEPIQRRLSDDQLFGEAGNHYNPSSMDVWQANELSLAVMRRVASRITSTVDRGVMPTHVIGSISSRF